MVNTVFIPGVMHNIHTPFLTVLFVDRYMRKASILLLFLLVMVSCSKDQNTNAEKDPYYWSKITVFVDGMLWGDCRPGLLINSNTHNSEGAHHHTRPYFRLSFNSICRELDNGLSEMIIYAYEDLVEGRTYSFTDSIQTLVRYRDPSGGTGNFFYTDSIHNGELSITSYDSLNVSGNFHFIVYNKDLDSTISLTNGRFESVRVN